MGVVERSNGTVVKGHGVSFGSDENVLNLIMVLFVQLVNVLNTVELYTLKE